MLNKSNRLKKGIVYCIKKGNKFFGNYTYISFIKNQSESNRVGFIVTKKVGNAVNRNKLKRQLRGITREFLPTFRYKVDIVIISNTSKGKWTKMPSYLDLKQEILSLLRSSNIIN